MPVYRGCPWAADNPLGRDEILKGDLNAVHRTVAENGDVHYGGKAEQIKLPIPVKRFFKPVRETLLFFSFRHNTPLFA